MFASFEHITLAQESPTLAEAEQKAFQQAVATAAPCVVQIETFGGLDRAEDGAATEGPITGTIVGEEGWIIASLHGLREQPASILVNLPDGTRASAKIVSRDIPRELALLKVETSNLLPRAFPSEPGDWQVGAWCIAIGKTYDAKSVTQSYGILSALGRAYGRAVQTDAKVSPINYGGPLVDLHGKVIGILTPLGVGGMFEESSAELYDSGIGFAVPLVDVLKRMPKMQSGKDIQAGKLGIVLEDSNEMSGPVKLSGAAPGSPAARAGVQAGDTIVAVRGQPIELLADFRHALAQFDAGDVFEFSVQRGDELLLMSCELVAEIPVYRKRYLGIQAEPIEGGLEVRSVINSSPASAAGLKVGQILVRCNDTELKENAGLLQILSVADLGVPLEFAVQTPGDNPTDQTVSIRPVTWPVNLIEFEPPMVARPKSPNQEKLASDVQMLELKLADIPNKIHAIIPPKPGVANSRPWGCLIVYSEPGELSPDKLKANWEKFAKDYGWLIVFPASANAQTWSRDEVELASRLLARLDQEYTIDPSRTAIGGIGVGGQLALFASLAERERVQGVFTIGTELRRFPIRQPSAPMQTLDFLFIGDRQLESVVEQLDKFGHVAHSIAIPDLDTSKWETVPQESLSRWLEGLGYF